MMIMSNLTKKEFEKLLKRASQPKMHDSKVIGTSESRLSDDCSDRSTGQDTTEDTED